MQLTKTTDQIVGEGMMPLYAIVQMIHFQNQC